MKTAFILITSCLAYTQLDSMASCLACLQSGGDFVCRPSYFDRMAYCCLEDDTSKLCNPER
jgi:hypothetical protein